MKHPTLGRRARRVMTVGELTGGIDVTLPPHRIADDRLSEACNLWRKNGVLTTRPAVCEAGTFTTDPRTAYTVTPLGRYAFVHGKGPQQHLLALADQNGTLRGKFADLPGYRALTAVPSRGDIVSDDGREAVVYLDSDDTDMRGAYELTVDGSLVQQLPHVPTVLSAARPTVPKHHQDSGAYLEPFNRLTEMFRCRYTSDGEGLYYWLPQGVTLDMNAALSVTYVDMLGGELLHTVNTYKGDGVWYEKYATDEEIPVDELSLHVDTVRGCFWFEYAHSGGPAPLEITVANNVTLFASRTDSGNLALVCGMRFGTWFGGGADGTVGGTRLFLSGNTKHPNLVQWSALNDPLYLPENNYAYVGDSSSAVTAFGKQSDMLVIFKEREVYATQYRLGGTVTAEALMNGTVTDTETAAAVFPMQLIHPEIGCDCPNTVRLCGDRLVWLCSNGRAYALYSSGAYDVRSVRAVSQPIEAALADCTEFALRTATAVSWEGWYLLWLDGTAYVLDGSSTGLAHYGSFATAEGAQAAMAWYRWELPLRGMLTDAGGVPLFLVPSGQTLVAHTFGEAAQDTVLGVQYPLTTRLSTKWYELGAPEQYKRLSFLRLWLTGDADEQVTVSLCDGDRRDVAVLRLNGAPLSEAAVRLVPLGTARARYAAVALTCTGRMTVDRLEIGYHRMGEIRE
ncbi:MAG: hypothetical protein IKB04_09225 [Clostridia bacterium]|nr:hypothetical protein [Clostridia bacterium]MBR2407199.1 hypothetical protein [Clostridia bacterium]